MDDLREKAGVSKHHFMQGGERPSTQAHLKIQLTVIGKAPAP
jgi:hypothetical protein